MTNIWLPLVPPANPPTPTPGPGWQLQLANCNAQDDLQIFAISKADGTVIHTSTGACVSQTLSIPRSTLTLAKCGASDGSQTWYKIGSELSNTTNTNSGDCVNWNNVNNVLPAGNPIIAYSCSPSQWNAQWSFPSAGTPGLIQALDSNGGNSGMCASIASVEGQWTLTWQDQWSLKDY